MKTKDTKKNNSMIAEFMGYKLITPAMRFRPEDWKHAYWENPDAEDVTRKVLCAEKYLEYHSSYDWLMPVVDKIESLSNCMQTKLSKDMNGNFNFGILWYQHYTSDGMWFSSRLDAIYSAVLDFIRFYNNNIKNEKDTVL